MMRFTLLLGAAAVCAAQTCDAGLGQDEVSPLVRVYKNTIPGDLLGAVTIEALFMTSLMEDGRSKTIWMKKDDWETPQENEQALSHLVRRLYQAEVSAAAEEGRDMGKVVGAELWVHHKQLNWRMGGPHFDKDEITYSQQFKEKKPQSTMAFPIRGTVTYLSDCGGPTVVYNQTMTEDLTALIPEVPREAAVIWPEVGKHITFAGNAYHQVRGDYNLNLFDGNCTTRTTLLVNWWDHQVPGDEFTAEWRAKHEMPAPPKIKDEAPLTREPIAVVENPEEFTRHTVALFPTTAKRKGERAFHFTLPKGGCCGKGCVVRWTNDEVIANVPVLDSTNVFVFQEAMNVKPEKPSIILFHNPDEFRSAARLAATVEAELGLNAYVVDVAHSPGVLGLFKIGRDDVPTAGMFDGKVHTLGQGTEVTLDAIMLMVTKREGGAKMGDPYKNTIDIDVMMKNVMTADTLARCTERGMERLMLTSRGMRTHCAFLLPGKEKANLAKFKKGLSKWEQKANTKAWEVFYVQPGEEELFTSAIADVPDERPLFAVIDPEFKDVISWPEAGQSNTATSVQFAEWLKLVDKSRLSKKGL